MFLAGLSNRQKELFRDISIFIAFSDGNYADSEKAVLRSYCTEMNIPYTESTTTSNIHEAIDEIVNISSDNERKAIGFEIMGMVMADGVYEDSERVCVEEYSKKTGIPMKRFDNMASLVTKIYAMNDEIRKTVFFN